MILAIGILLVIIAVIALTTLGASVRVLREYERGVVFRLGRVMDLRGPGLILLVPTIDRMVRISLRTVTLTVPPQEIITRDNVPVARDRGHLLPRRSIPNKAVNEVENFHNATLQIAQTTLRVGARRRRPRHLLSEREHLNESLQQVIDAQTEPWGIKVTTVEIKDVEIPERMQHAIARQAEAERERRAKIINAEGEAQAATRLADAADIIGRNPTTLQLRYLQTLREIGATQNTTDRVPDADRSGQAGARRDSVGTGGHACRRAGAPGERCPRFRGVARARPRGHASTCCAEPCRSGQGSGRAAGIARPALPRRWQGRTDRR